MPNMRLIARLDLKGSHLIKGVHLEGLRVIGDPHERALRYYEQGIDELIYMDAVASLYQRNSLADVVRRTSAGVFVPMTVGGGIRSTDDVNEVLRAGADKVAINTAAVKQPEVNREVARRLGWRGLGVGPGRGRGQGGGGWGRVADRIGRRGSAVISHPNSVEQGHRGAAGSQLAEMGPRRLDRLFHLIIGIFLNLRQHGKLL